LPICGYGIATCRSSQYPLPKGRREAWGTKNSGSIGRLPWGRPETEFHLRNPERGLGGLSNRLPRPLFAAFRNGAQRLFTAMLRAKRHIVPPADPQRQRHLPARKLRHAVYLQDLPRYAPENGGDKRRNRITQHTTYGQGFRKPPVGG